VTEKLDEGRSSAKNNFPKIDRARKLVIEVEFRPGSTFFLSGPRGNVFFIFL
jgi:hypothetical protein